MATISSNDVWAVGTSTAAKGDDHGQVLHWDGRSWNNMPFSEEYEYSQVHGVAALSSKDVWIVGTSTWHWDGAHWRNIPAVAGGGAELEGVSVVGPDDVWAVGEQGFIARWEGKTWARISSPISALYIGFSAPAAAGRATWFVGWASYEPNNATPQKGLLMRYGPNI